MNSSSSSSSSSSSGDIFDPFYRDYAHAINTTDSACINVRRSKYAETFPTRLYWALAELEQAGLQHIASWQPHGRCFVVRCRKDFVSYVLHRWFSQSSYASFQRQLNIYGFTRIKAGPDKGGHYHERFLRGKPFLPRTIGRIKNADERNLARSGKEPNFYAMLPVAVTSDDHEYAVGAFARRSNDDRSRNEQAIQAQPEQSFLMPRPNQRPTKRTTIHRQEMQPPHSQSLDVSDIHPTPKANDPRDDTSGTCVAYSKQIIEPARFPPWHQPLGQTFTLGPPLNGDIRTLSRSVSTSSSEGNRLPHHRPTEMVTFPSVDISPDLQQDIDLELLLDVFDSL